MQEHKLAATTALPIVFDGVLAIVGGGTVDTDLLRQLRADGAFLVGADGGGDVIAEAGFVPEAIIGDMDSLEDPDSWEGNTQLVRIAEQETTDFEKTLYATTAPVTVALGMTGKRFDHTLAALDAVARYARDRRIVLVDEHDIALAVSGEFSFAVAAGERVSVHPLAPVTFARSAGLNYPLDGLRLAPGERTGTSNAATVGPFSIEPGAGERGAWLLILDKRHLQALIDRLLLAKA